MRPPVAIYYGMITRLDDQFGRVMKRAGELGYWDSTAAMFFADYGEYLGDHGLIEKWPPGSWTAWCTSPFIVGGAVLPEGIVYEETAEMVDLVPTVLHMAGMGKHFPHCGKSLAQVLVNGGREGAEGRFLLSEESPELYDKREGRARATQPRRGHASRCLEAASGGPFAGR